MRRALTLEQLEVRELLTGPAGIVVVAPSPPQGLPGGGTVLTVNGQDLGDVGSPPNVGFLNLDTQLSTPGTSVAITIANAQLQVTQPQLALGTYNIIVSNGSGTSPQTGPTGSSAYFVVSQVAPTVTAVTTFGLPGDVITVGGTGFTGATAVSFQSRNPVVATPGTGLTIQNDSQLQITVPTLALGTYDVTVTNPAGTSSVNQATDAFVVVAPAIVAATHFTSSQSLVGLTTLPVLSTNDFTATGSVFVQSETGVATISYTAVTPTSFTGCTVVANDPFNVGANATTGNLDLTYHAVYQATNQTYDLTFANATSLTTEPQSDIYVSMFWSSAVLAPAQPVFFYLNSANADGSDGKYSPVTNLNVGATLPSYKISTKSGDAVVVKVPYLPTNSARFVIGVGAPATVQVVKNSSGDIGVGIPSPLTSTEFYDYVEFTLDANSADNSVPNGLRALTSLNINTSQVDQFGMPLTLSGKSLNEQGVPTPTTLGVTLSINVARDAIFKSYATLHPAATDPYGPLIIPSASAPDQPLRILNPGKLSIATTNPLGNVFDQAVHQLFEVGPANLTLTSGVNQEVYTSTRTTNSGYDVLAFSGPDITTVYIYEPFFSSNAPTGTNQPSSASYYANKPAAPSWLTNSTETSGQMVFGNDGVFGDSGLQPGLSSTQQSILADLENQVVAALNRGVANSYSTTADWQTPAYYYQGTTPENTANLYAQFLHEQAINNTAIFIDHKAYAIAYDDQGGQNPTLVMQNLNNVAVTMGPWQQPTLVNNSAKFVNAIYLETLGRNAEAAGLTFWTSLLNSGSSRAALVSAIISSAEGRAHTVNGLFEHVLNRPADAGGLSFFVGLLTAGSTQDELKTLLYGSAEYFQVHAGNTNEGFLTTLFQNELGRTADPAGTGYFWNAFASGVTRQSVALTVLTSLETDQVLTQNYYHQYLGRAADTAGFAFWVNALQQGRSEGSFLTSLLASDEFLSKI